MYYIGIEDLVANALIELVERTENRTVKFETLSKYGDIVIKKLRDENQEAFLITSRDQTNEFIHNCTDYFSIDEKASTITLKENVKSSVLRDVFRMNIAFNVLLAFVSKEALSALGIKAA